MDLPPELEFERLSNEEKYQRAVPGYMRRLRDLYEAIHERSGDEGLELIRKVSVVTVSRCPYPFTRDAVCRAHTCMEQALVATLDSDLE